jgi:two-component system, NarL family, nitrate/nitrite response regulator NarL
VPVPFLVPLPPESRTPLRVLVADDHAIVRHGLRCLLREGGFEVVGEAKNGAEAASLTRALQPDVLLLDLLMPTYSGMDALELLSTLDSRTRILLLTASAAPSEIATALRLGAHGLLLKECGAETLFEAIRAVHDGHLWLQWDDVVDAVLAGPKSVATLAAQEPERQSRLNQRELEIVGLVASGRSNKEIAATYSMHESAVKHQLRSIFAKTGVSSRLELTLFAVHRRIA